MSRVAPWARVAGGVGILALLVSRLGAAPFFDAVRVMGVRSIVAAAAIGAVTTVCSAWRWRLVTRNLSIPVPLPAAIAAYYRSQFLNSVLPGGVVGDLHRGVRHGHDVGAVGRSLRAVGWERSLGQGVQLSLTVLILLLLPAPAGLAVPLVVALTAAAAVAGGLLLWGRRRRGGGVGSGALSFVTDDLRNLLRAPGRLVRIVLASAVVVAGHAAVFLVAARASGVSMSLDRLLPVALVVLMASAVPTNIGGWGPREGAAAWAFGAAGVTAAQGVTAAVAYGVLVLVATLPGAVVLVTARARRPGPPGRDHTGSSYLEDVPHA
jgi:uncharacterized membrane protein YbhN (UPF0104 family)